MGRSTAHVFETFFEDIKELHKWKLLQASSDGPHANLPLFIYSFCKKNSCLGEGVGLQVIHGSMEVW